MKGLWLALATVLGLAVQAMPASAAFTWTYSLKCTTSGCGSTTYGTVQLLQVGSGSSAKIQVTVNLASGYAFNTAGSFNNGYALMWNLSGNPTTTLSNVPSDFTAQNSNSGHTYAALTSSNGSTPFTTSPCSTAGNCFEYAIKDTTLFSSDSSLVFDVTKSGGLTMSSASNPFTKDNGGYYFAAYVTKNSDSMWIGGASDPVPEPMTWTMSIAGLLGLAGFAVLDQRRKKVSRLG